jgi:triacylglycerol lipase
MVGGVRPKVRTRTGNRLMTSGTRNVILVHGIFDTGKIFRPMIQSLEGNGFRPLAPNLTPGNGDLGLDQLASQVAAFVQEHIPQGEQFDLVGFSMGGLVSRFYVQRLGGVERVGRLITISAPHHGTWWAHTVGNPGSRHMRRGSSFLADLNREAAMLERVKFVSIWTPFDLMILPAKSSSLGVGTEFRIPVALHPWMPKSRRCAKLVVKLLQEFPSPVPNGV